MGQQQSTQMIQSQKFRAFGDYPNGAVVQEIQSPHLLHFLKEYSYTNQQTYQQAFINFSKKLPEKHEHILSLERTNTKIQNTFCSTFYKIGLMFEYIEHNLAVEINQRKNQGKLFEQKQIWSILCSCTLAMSEMVKLQGRCHSAIRPQDIRLTKEGVVKILHMEMIGMDKDHDLEEGTTRMLAESILTCLLMEDISSQNSQYIEELIQGVDASLEIKNILSFMNSDEIKFIDVEEYLFKLVQEENDSIGTYSNTPILNQRIKTHEMCSNIPEDSKEDELLNNLKTDQEDKQSNLIFQMKTQEFQNPDQNDAIDDSKTDGLSSRGTLRQKSSNIINSSGKKYIQNSNSSSKQKQNYTQSVQITMEKKQSKKDQIPKSDKNLFTDPKLLNLIQTDLDEIKKRKSVANSQKSNLYQSSSKLSGYKQSSICDSSIQKQSENQQCLMMKLVENPKRNTKSHKQLGQNENHKYKQEKFENIMENQQMGFKKNKIRPKDEPHRVRFMEDDKQFKQEKQNHPYQSMQNQQQKYQYLSNESSSNNNNWTYKSKKGNSNLHSESSERGLEYVNETYIKGRYEGTKLNNMRQGKGIFFYNEGGKYTGQWKQNKMHGKGVLYYPNNQIAYEGQWRDDQLSGFGTLYNQQVTELETNFDYRDFSEVDDYWVKYEGNFLQDNKAGQGRLQLVNGQLFEGQFRDDEVHGPGIFYRKDGSQIRGFWEFNKLVKYF